MTDAPAKNTGPYLRARLCIHRRHSDPTRRRMSQKCSPLVSVSGLVLQQGQNIHFSTTRGSQQRLWSYYNNEFIQSEHNNGFVINHNNGFGLITTMKSVLKQQWLLHCHNDLFGFITIINSVSKQQWLWHYHSNVFGLITTMTFTTQQWL